MSLRLKYFVLKPVSTSEDDSKQAHAFASRRAMATYAFHIEATDPLLSEELMQWVRALEEEP